MDVESLATGSNLRADQRDYLIQILDGSHLTSRFTE